MRGLGGRVSGDGDGKYTVLAVVPARGGSKGLPGKNLLPLGSRSVVALAIDAGRAASLVDRVLCSTDDEDIAAAARAAGADVPFLRPPELAEDNTEDWPVFLHALQWLETHENWIPDIVVNLRPTSPFRRAEHVDAAVRLLISSGADSVKSVSLARQHPHKMWLLSDPAEPILEPYVKTPFRLERGPDVPRAQLDPVYWQNGIVDATWRRVILVDGVMIGSRVAGLVTDPADAIDLDSALDYVVAQVSFEERLGTNRPASRD